MTTMPPISPFVPVQTRAIPSLRLELQEFRHEITGARHFHFKSEHNENVFMVALRTVPTDSTGVAHILEHTTLCGSERFPVRDPFFMMSRRSLNTFMNAFTSSDWTAYPFASQNRKDFFNLLDVYLDAVFFPNLHPLDFAQEGHRIEFAEPANPDSELVYKGVVYNEMKGAMSSPFSQVWAALTRYLYPTTTYHHNSGGDPAEITHLTHDQLHAFYRRHYHPSNAVFMTFGDTPVESIQDIIHSRALARFDAGEGPVQIPKETRYFAPLRVQESYPVNDDDLKDKTHIVVGWLLGQASNLEVALEAHLLTNVLLENSASPLLKALETSDLGKAPSGLCGLEDSHKEMTFVCGLEGCEPENADAVEALILEVLEDVAEQGVPLEKMEAVLHQLELSQREISGDSYPYGLQLMLAALSPALEGVDPATYLDLDSVIVRLRDHIQDPDYIRRLVRTHLLENMHRVRLVMTPDNQMEQRREHHTREQLAAVKAQLDDEAKAALVARATALEARQARKDADDILPRVTLADVPSGVPWVQPASGAIKGGFCSYNQGTNGLVYQQLIRPLPALDLRERQLLPLLTYLLPEVGHQGRSYLDVQERQSAVTGGISAFWDVRAATQDEQSTSGVLVVSGKALARNAGALLDLLDDTAHRADFSETDRVRELVSLLASRRSQGVANNAHGLAMSCASQHLSPVSSLTYLTSGLESIQRLSELDRQLRDDSTVQSLCGEVEALLKKVMRQPLSVLTIAEEEQLRLLNPAAQARFSAFAGVEPQSVFGLENTREHTRMGWLINAQVNYCAMAFATVPGGHRDAPALTVLGHLLRNEFLHSAVREKGGAYGSGASQNNGDAIFRFYSYRDPRMDETLADFRRSLDWFVAQEHSPLLLEQAILGVISSLDKPRSPAGEAKHAFHSDWFGRGGAYQDAFRRGVLGLQIEDLKRVAKTYLIDKPHSIAVVGGEAGRGRMEKLGLEVKKLKV